MARPTASLSSMPPVDPTMQELLGRPPIGMRELMSRTIPERAQG